MEYEAFEPEQDEYYDQACQSAYARMFNTHDEKEGYDASGCYRNGYIPVDY